MANTQTNTATDLGANTAASRRSKDMFAAAGRHSRRVQLLKRSIPIAALLGAGLFSMATIFRPEVPMNVSTGGVSLSDGRIVMASPKLDGVTKDNKPYAMRAERAFQNVKTGVIELETISASLPFSDKATAKLTAKGGTYDNAARKMELKDQIILQTSDGMTAKLQSAFIDMAANHLSSSDPVDITTPSARITADTMSVTDGGKQLVFDRRVRMTINPGALSDAKAAAN